MFGLHYMCVLWLVLFEIFSISYYSCADVNVSTLLDFSELHFTYCASSQLCSIKNNRSSEEAPNEVCCYYCSCEKECEHDDTCCPDLFFRDVNGNLTITDAKTWRQNAQHINYTVVLRRAEDIPKEENNNVYDCVDSRLTSKECFGTPFISNAYQMVAVCPDRTTANSTIRELCTVSGKEKLKTMVESNSSDLEVIARIVTPVTSLKSNITFKNIYCLVCSEEGISESAFIPWEAFILDSYNSFGGEMTDHPYEIVATILTEFRGNCIIMKPPNSTQHLTPRKCNPSFKTCPLGTDERLDLFCRSFNLPVTQTSFKGDLTIYKNIACYLCNNIKPVWQRCSRYYQKSYSVAEIKLNFRPTEGFLAADLRPSTSYGDMTERFGWQNNGSRIAIANSSYMGTSKKSDQKLSEESKLTDMQKLSSAYCNHKLEFEKCGEVMCPMFFYLSDGECIPTFVNFSGLYFSIHIDVRVEATWTFTKPRVMIVLPVIFRYLDNLAKTFFSEYSFDIWYTIEKKMLRNIVVILNFISMDPDFISVINTTDYFLGKMADLTFQTPLGIVDFGFKVTNEYFYYYGVTVNNTEIPYLTDYYFRTFEPYKRGLELNVVLKNVKILEAMGCYRIVIEQLLPINVFGYPQLKNSKIISIKSWNLTTNLIKYITCLEAVFPTEFRTSETYMYPGFAGKVLNPIEPNERIDTGINKPGNEATSTFSFEAREAVITAVLVGVAIILITVRICRKRISSIVNVDADNFELENTPQNRVNL